MPDVLGETVPNVGAKIYLKSVKAMGFVIEVLEFEHNYNTKNIRA